MKKHLLLIATIALTACGYNTEEQMLYDFENSNVEENLNTNIDELDFELIKVQKDSVITGKDSARYHKIKLAEMWYGSDKQLTPEMIDTLTFEGVIDRVERVIEINDELIILKTRAGEYTYKEESDLKKWREAKSNVKRWSLDYQWFEKYHDSVLSTTYYGEYSIKNPLLNNVKQTLKKTYFTNPEGTEFVRSEAVKS